MQPKKLKIFKKKKGLYLYPHHWVFVILCLIIAILISIEYIFEFSLKDYIFISMGFLLLSFIVVEIRNQFIEQKEVGEYCGEIIFSESKIQIDKDEFEISEILKLDFVVASDIQNRYKISYSFSPRLSHGLDNIFILTLKNGKKIEVNFLQTEWQRLKVYKEIFVHYFKEGILGWISLLDILTIKDYAEIQIFKKEINYGQQDL